jgi:hypothetical protein
MGFFNVFKKKNKFKSFDELYSEIIDKAYNEEIQDDDLKLLTHKEQIFFVLSIYEMEINNGGLCQFFVNSSRAYAGLVIEFLEELGALEHLKLYQDFIVNNNIDFDNLDMFDMDDLEEFEEKNQLYPFDEFDDKFGELKPLCDYLEEFMNK